MAQTLENHQIRKLKALAQRSEPLLRIGKTGASPGFIQGMKGALAQHELVKVKFIEFKEEKKTIAAEIAAQTDSSMIMLVGNVAVFYRQNPDPEQRKVKLDV
jgi:RNA-binding protein